MLNHRCDLWLLATFVFSTPAVQAALPEAPPEFAWAVQAGGKSHDKTRGLTVDTRGNVFLTGEFVGTSQFGEHTLTSAGAMDFFIAKCDSNGKFLWARSAGGSGTDRGYGVATDAAGNCYVTGHFQSTNATFSGVAVPNSGDYDIFVAKYDAAGRQLWVRTAGGKGYDYGHGIAVDARGNVFVTGALVGEGAFGDLRITAAGGAHVFCARYDSDGKLLWARTAEGRASNSGHGIAVDGAGNAYIGGYTGGAGTLGGLALTNATGRDVLVAKLTPDGIVAWVSEGHGSTNALAHEITCDRAGNVWASGMFKGLLKLADRTVTSHGDNDLFLTSFDPAGKRLWTRTGGGPRVDYGLGVATDGA
ncbi:MAG: SBBP repeat-containing protein, partial [Verrucomicrobia bacterium]|nr:SBBP repeat-containing protein [Verrucomicrobiota bacterium]